MKTCCYCVGCKKHPLHDKRNELHPWLTNDACEAEVDCLQPVSDSLLSMGADISREDWPYTQYEDGQAETHTEDWTIIAACDNEEHEE